MYPDLKLERLEVRNVYDQAVSLKYSHNYGNTKEKQMYIVTFGFKRAWRDRCKTKALALCRRMMKKTAHRRHRRAVKNEISCGRYDFDTKPMATSYEVS